MVNEIIQDPEGLRIAGLITLVSLGILLILGLTERVIIFNDRNDVALTFGIVLIPFATLLYISFGEPSSEAGQAAHEAYYAQPWISTVFIISIMGSLACAISITWISIRENGLLLGIPIAALKVATTVITLFVIFCWFASRDKKRSKGKTVLSTILFLSVIGWLMSLLVNGDRVRLKRIQAGSS